MNTILLNIWRSVKDPNRYMILYQNQIPYPQSPSSLPDWTIIYTFKAFNPLIRPFPTGCQLYIAIHKNSYPFDLQEVVATKHTYDLTENGTYFVTYASPHYNTKQIMIGNKNLFILSS